jgi:hypothetical protein
MAQRLLLLSCLIFLSFCASAQNFSVTGHTLDAKDNSPLIGVTVVLVSTADTSAKSGTVTDVDGNFALANVHPGSYTLRVIYLGYTTITRALTVADKDIALGTLSMSAGAKELKGVTIAGKQVRAEQKGDTSSFNADAYKTNPDASAEDLVNKMPGVTSDGSGVKVNGEAVQQVYVDGKPFFGTDPTLALKNLPAEVIDKIQVFDKLSDQATFTGFDDGSGQKTLNIITRRNKSEGVFGKVYAGYGTDDRYLAGGNLNFFNGNRRISILGMSNNINQQNFSAEDVLGITSGAGNGGGSRGGNFSGGSRGGGGGGANNFLVGQQNGITKTNSFGFNYSDNWGKKLKVTGSYFFNATDNVTGTDLTRNYFTSSDSTNIYNEHSSSEATNQNHRINMRFEYTIDSYNSIIFIPGISFQQNGITSVTDAVDSIGGRPASTTNTTNTANNHGYNSTDNLLIQHKFKKPRRTISLNVNTAFNEKIGTGSYNSMNTYFDALVDSTGRDQRYTLYNNTSTLGGNLTYTEPVGKKGQVMANYNPSYSWRNSDKETFDRDSLTKDYKTSVDTPLSNRFNSTYTYQRGGLSYRIGDKRLNFNAGVNLQYSILDGTQIFPHDFPLQRTFTNWLPNAMFNYRFEDGRNLRIMYRTSTTEPSIAQLQNVVDISNPLLLHTGNAALSQTFEQTLIVRYGLTKSKNAHSFFFNLYTNYVDNYIGNQNIIPTRDSVFIDPVSGVIVPILKGSQLSRPVNLDGYWNTRSFFTYGLPLGFMKSNLNLNGGFNWSRTPGVLNDVTNYSTYYTPTFGVVLSSNISENVDFTLSYSGNYNVVRNTVQSQGNTEYYSHVAGLRFNWIFLKNVVFNTNITHNFYTSFGSAPDQSFILWNAYVGYKMLKNHALEARISVYDLLNQNQAIARNVTSLYVENSVTQVLKQYFMFQLTYTIRNFKGTMPAMDAPARPEGTPPFPMRGDRPGQ